MGKLIFTVPGTPKGKGRPRATTIGGHARMYTTKDTELYENRVAMAAREAMEAMGARELIVGPVAMIVLIRFMPPKSMSAKKRASAVITDRQVGEILASNSFALTAANAIAKCQFNHTASVIHHTTRPDADNVLKSILDGMNGVVFNDDAQAWAIMPIKFYSETPGVDVVVFWNVANGNK